MSNKNKIQIQQFATKIGAIQIGVLQDKICLFDFVHRVKAEPVLQRIAKFNNAEFVLGTHEIMGTAIDQLNEYLKGERTIFDLPLVFSGTEFQCKVWGMLMKIPYGETWSYQKLALSLGSPNLMRAVAAANGANCLAIIVPCHRVIGSNGNLTGYAGGLTAKRSLLNLESEHNPNKLRLL